MEREIFTLDTVEEIFSASSAASRAIQGMYPDDLTLAVTAHRGERWGIRQLKYTIGQMIEPVVTAGVHEIRHLDASERFLYAASYLMPYAEQLGEDTTTQLHTAILQEAAVLDVLESENTAPILYTDELIAGADPQACYRLIGYLAGGDENKEHLITPQMTLLAMHMSEGSSSISELKEKLTAGLFDKSIAAGMLRRIQRYPERSFSNGTGRIAALSRFFIQASGIQDPQAALEVMVDNIDVWPNEEQQAVRTKRDSFVGMIAGLQQKTGLRFGDYCTDVISEPDLLNNISSFKEHMDKLAATETPNLHAIFLEMKRPQPFDAQKEIKTSLGSVLAEKYESLTDAKFKLVGINCTKGRFSQTEVPVEGKIKEYIQATGQRDKQLEADLVKVLQWMANLDFENRQAYGAKKFVETVRPEGDISPSSKTYGLWEFKPKDAPGLSLKSLNADGIRVLFIIMEDNTLGLLTFAERSNLYEALNRVSGSKKQSHR